MSKTFVEAPGGADSSLHIECMCHGGTALVIDAWKWDKEDDEYTIEVGHDLYKKESIKERLKACWLIIRGKTYGLAEGIIDQNQLCKLRDWLNKEFPKQL